MVLADLIAGLGLRVVAGDPARCRASDLTEDSRTALPGSLFVARRGLKADGRAFAAAAVAAGATAVLTDDPAVALDLPEGVVVLISDDVPLTTARLAERFFGEPSSSLFLIGVTGTNGKTTVATAVHQILNAVGIRCGLIGTVEVDDGTGRAPADMTTPAAIEVSRTLSVMVEHRCRAAVMEVSSHALDQGRAAALRFDAGVVTNITRDHLDYHGTMEAYAAAKARLFALVDRSGKGPRLSIVNADDPDAVAIAGQRRVPCTVSGDALRGWSARALDTAPDGMRLRVAGPGVTFEQRVNFIGRHNASNLLLACAACAAAMRGLGVREEAVGPALRRGLSLARPPAGRLEPVHDPSDEVRVFIDYAHTDDALDKALEGVRAAVPAGAALWVVFGAGGQKDTGKRPRMGRAASLRADRVVLTSDNPRAEPPSRIIADVLAGVPEGRRDRVIVHADRAKAIETAVASARPGDVVVIAGKGHERVQIAAGDDGVLTERPFDDAAEARAALERRAARAAAGQPA